MPDLVTQQSQQYDEGSSVAWQRHNELACTIRTPRQRLVPGYENEAQPHGQPRYADPSRLILPVASGAAPTSDKSTKATRPSSASFEHLFVTYYPIHASGLRLDAWTMEEDCHAVFHLCMQQQVASRRLLPSLDMFSSGTTRSGIQVSLRRLSTCV